MTNSSGRSLTEIIVAVVFVGFLTGFIVVLCIGNYYRAKQAMERQKQRRLARLSGGGGIGGIGDKSSANGVDSSPRSNYSAGTSGGSTRTSDGGDSGGPTENQHLLAVPSMLPRRRGPMVDENANDLLLFDTDTANDESKQSNRRQPALIRV